MERTPTGEDKTPVESPPLEGEEAKVEGGSGPRNELDPALAFALDSFKTAVGQVRDAPPAEDEVESWGLALSKAEPELKTENLPCISLSSPKIIRVPLTVTSS